MLSFIHFHSKSAKIPFFFSEQKKVFFSSSLGLGFRSIMCILCVIQKWSRRVATMLPWLVIPLIGLWALSQLLPPAFRFEITSPRLACVFVLLVTLFWYEVLMPQLSAWRVRRNARLRERKRTEAVELQKLRKTATRRCRNCLNAYRDQNPAGGRFMCSYCGHVSRRPVLNLAVGPGPGNGPGGLVGKDGKVSWMRCGGGGSWGFGGDEDCLGEKSYCGALFFACKVILGVLVRVRWLLGKVFRVGWVRGECEGDGEGKGRMMMMGRNGENGLGMMNESRGEKARRKAEEKRQARLERELFEEEEKKQREEVARLVEERRRKMRDVRMDGHQAEKDHGKPMHSVREKDSRKEAERKRLERRREREKEKDKGSSKSNSDVEEVEKRTGKDSERKREFDKKSETDQREHQKYVSENGKRQTVDNVHGKNVVNNYNRGSSGTRYFDSMRGSIFSSSKAFGFGRGTTNVPANAVKDSKFNSSVDHVYTASTRRDVGNPERPTAKSNVNGDDRNINHSVLPEPQPWTAPKKSWQQLFTRSSSVPQSLNSSVICRPNSKNQAEAKSPQLSGQSSVTQSFDNPINFGLPSPFNLTTFPNGSTSSSLRFSPPIEPLFSPVGEVPRDFRHEEQELFEDPCYVPDPVALLGPVSESLDDFQLDNLGSRFVMDMEVDKPRSLKSTTAGYEVNNSKCSPIESRLSREKLSYSNRFASGPQVHDAHAFHLDDATANVKGTWQMWNSSPLGQEGLGLVGVPGSWLLHSQRNIPNKDDFALPSSQKTLASLSNKDDIVVSSAHSPQNVFLPGGQSGGTFGPVTGSSGYDPWSQTTLFPQLSSLKAQEGATPDEMIYGIPSGSASSYVGEGSPVNGWSKKEWHLHGSVESIGKPSIARTQIGAQHPAQDVQSFW